MLQNNQNITINKTEHEGEGEGEDQPPVKDGNKNPSATSKAHSKTTPTAPTSGSSTQQAKEQDLPVATVGVMDEVRDTTEKAPVPAATTSAALDPAEVLPMVPLVSVHGRRPISRPGAFNVSLTGTHTHTHTHTPRERAIGVYYQWATTIKNMDIDCRMATSPTLIMTIVVVGVLVTLLVGDKVNSLLLDDRCACDLGVVLRNFYYTHK